MILEFPILDEKVHSLPLYIEEIGHLDNQDPVIRNSQYENNQLLICTGGKGRLLVEGMEYTITKENIFFTKAHIPHEYYALDEPWQIHWIVFNGQFLETLLDQLQMDNHQVFEMPSTTSIKNTFDQALDLIQSKNEKKHIECSVLIYQLLTQLSYCKKINMMNQSKSKQETTFEGIKYYLEAHFKEDISLDDLSLEFGLSTYYICRVFKAYNPIGLNNYLNKYRIAQAKKLLVLQGEMIVKDIAIQTGFRSASYFTKLFKQIEGMTPVQFRQLYGIG